MMQSYEKFKEKCKIFIKIFKEKEKKKCVSVNRTFTSPESGLGSVYNSGILNFGEVAAFLFRHLRLCFMTYDWGALYDTSDVDEQVGLLATCLTFVVRCGGSLFLIRRHLKFMMRTDIVMLWVVEIHILVMFQVE
jgi:hypothetical protein